MLHSADVLVHAAYDCSLTRPADIWRVNVDRTFIALLEAAATPDAPYHRLVKHVRIRRDDELYGRDKLDIEAMTVASGGCVVDPASCTVVSRPGRMAADFGGSPACRWFR